MIRKIHLIEKNFEKLKSFIGKEVSVVLDGNGLTKKIVVKDVKRDSSWVELHYESSRGLLYNNYYSHSSTYVIQNTPDSIEIDGKKYV